MSFSLTKDEQKQLAEHSAGITEQRGKVEDALREFNEKMAVAHSELAAVVNAYNMAVVDARSFLEDIHSQAESDFADKSERWQEGERGAATQDWINSISDVLNNINEAEFDDSSFQELDAEALLGEDISSALDEIQPQPDYQ